MKHNKYIQPKQRTYQIKTHKKTARTHIQTYIKKTERIYLKKNTYTTNTKNKIK